jgi:GDPmannose 4,6-dehydratase
MAMKKALITGITGQDGSYVAELLLKKGYEVHGTIRRTSFEHIKNTNIFSVRDKLILHIGDISDPAFIYKTVFKVHPDELYHLAAQSYVSYSLNTEIELMDVNFRATYYLLNSFYDINPEGRFFFAGSSEMFGNPEMYPQNELTPFNPKSLYGISKVSSFHFLRNFREKTGFFCVSGIMYNHESPRRKNIFVTKKIIETAVKIYLKKEKELRLGNIEAQRDWGWAPEYIEGMWMMLNADKAEDYILATGKIHTVREFLEKTFNKLGLDYKEFLVIDDRFFRPSEKVPLCGDSTKAKENLGWTSRKNIDEIIEAMLSAELKKYGREL